MAMILRLPSVCLILAAFALGLPVSDMRAEVPEIRINEVMSSNASTLAGLDGEFDDWIEIFNGGDAAVDLGDWGLSDDPSRPFRWRFPEETWLAPGGYLIVRASGRDTTDVNAPETWIPAGAWWRYDDSGADHGNAFAIPGFDDSGWPQGQAPLGYAVPARAGYETTTIGFGGDPQNKHITTWFRRTFDVENPSAVQGVDLGLWIDDGAIVYINGIEVARENLQGGPVTAQTKTITYVGTWPRWNSYSVPSGVLIAGENTIAVRLHQHLPTSSDLIIDLELEAVVKRSELHAGFSISRDGEPLRLTDPDGHTVDAVDLPAIPRDVSYGRLPNDPEAWRFFDQPTPGAANTTTAYESVLAPPSFSVPPGVYADPVVVDAIHPEPDVVIRFTTDGRLPGPGDPIWSGPLTLNAQPWSPGPLAMIRTNPIEASIHRDYGWSEPIGEVPKARVLRLRAFKPDHLSLEDAGGTWWVGPGFTGRHTLDKVSLQIDPADFFKNERGIYIPGKIYDEGGFPLNDAWGRPHANYFQRGAEWERPAHFEFFEGGDPVAAGPVFTRIHGAGSRALAQKSLRLYDRSGGALAHRFFPGPRGRADEDFSRLILRNSGQDWYFRGPTMMKDAFLQQLFWHMEVDMQAYRPVVMYLNGEFWGIHNIRERVDARYLERRYGIPRDKVDLLNNNASVKAGDNLDYLDLRNFVHDESMADPANYAAATARIDIPNFIDYFIIHIFIANTDWPGNNIDYWRERRAPDPTAPTGRDGRWRWIAFDLDFGADPSNASQDMFSWLKNATPGYPSPLWSQMLIRGLWESPDFTAEFCNRFADHLNTTFQADRAHALADEMEAVLEEEIVPHFRRWGRGTSLSSWRSNVQRLRTFASNRPAHVWSQLQSHFPTGGTRTVTIHQPQPEAGTVRVNSLVIDGERTSGIPAGRPATWTGTWFAAWPVEIEALADHGWVFSHWLETGETESLIQVPTTTNPARTAVFVPAPFSTAAHYWSFNDSVVEPTHTLGGGALAITPGPQTEVLTDSGQDFAGLNNRRTEPTGSHLRINNAIGTTLRFSLPTPGLEPHHLTFEARRSNNGAALLTIHHTLDGEAWEPLGTFVPPAGMPALHEIDLSGIDGARNNPNFGVRIEISQGIGAEAGNVRIDNLALDVWPLEGTVLPPEPHATPDSVVWIAGEIPPPLDSAQWFAWPPDMTPALALESPVAGLATATDPGNGTLEVTPLRHGGGTFLITATSPGQTHGGPATLPLPLLIHPQPVDLATGFLAFSEWSPDAPAGSMPDHLLFLQGGENDSTLETPLPFAYHVPENDMAAVDVASGLLSLPYRLTTRTRITGLGSDGVSFINTGRGRDLGAALTTLDTRHIPAAEVLWTGGTVTPNSRHYAIRLQFRPDPDSPWTDLTHSGDTQVEYLRSSQAGDEQTIGPHPLPAAMLGQPRAQLRWTYHHVTGTSGPRDELRLDDIRVRIPAAEADSYPLWRAAHFAADDPAGDPSHEGTSGVANLLLYAYGLAPGQSPAAFLPAIDRDQHHYTFAFDPDRPGLRWVIRTSPDLADWSQTLFDSETHGTPATDPHGRASIPLPAHHDRLFLRLELLYLE